MKKMKLLSLILSLLLAAQCLIVPAYATEATDATVSWEDLFKEPDPVPFGSAQVENGCRTIEGMVPLAGSGVLLDTAQAAFLYEMDTQTVIYAYNPDMEIAPGSLTKQVTGYIAQQYLNLEDTVG